MDEIGEGYRTFLGLCSHEYFHSWNVKRIKPASFIPYYLSQESYTPLLWAFEGITSYYDDLMLLRSGRIDRAGYLELLGQTITRVLSGSGRHKQSLVESSHDAWSKFYKQDENAPNAIVSYYTKGSLVALALDLTLRHATHGERSLDGLMQLLWERHGAPLIGVTEEGFESLICEYAQQDLSEFLDSALRGTEDLSLDTLLAPFGNNLTKRPAEGSTDRGGKAATKPCGHYPSLGVRFSSIESGGIKIVQVFEGGAAHAGGISAGDRLIAIDGIEVKGGGLEARLQRIGVGSTITCHLFRRDELLELDCTLVAAPSDRCVLELHHEPSAEQQQRLNSWLPITGHAE